MAPFSIMTTFFAVFTLLISIVRATCYYPDGSTDSGHFACSSGGTSVCCAEGFQCLSNGFCNDQRYDNYERVLRGGCTDKGWGSGCPQTCTSIWPQGDEAIYMCGSGKFCCGRTDSCCDDSSSTKYDFGSPQVIAVAGESQAEATNAQVEESTPATTAQQQQEEQQQPTKAPATTQEKEEEPAPATTKQEEDKPSTTAAAATSKPATSKEPETSSEKSKEESSSSASSTAAATERSTSSVSAMEESTPLAATVTLVSDRTNAATASDSEAAPTQNVTNNYIAPSNNNTLAIAIGVGVGAGVLLFLIVLGACWYLRRKKKAKEPGAMRTSRGDVATEYFEIEGSLPPEAPGGMKNKWGRGSGILFELPATRIVEMLGEGEAKEADGKAVEKRGSRWGWPREKA